MAESRLPRSPKLEIPELTRSNRRAFSIKMKLEKGERAEHRRWLASSWPCDRRAPSKNEELSVVKKVKKRIRREYSKEDVKELRVHSRAKTPVARIVKLTRRTEGSLRQKARGLGISLGQQR